MDEFVRKHSHSIAVIVEHDEGSIRPVTYELLAHARELQRYASKPMAAVILGHSIKPAAEKIAATGVDVMAVSADQLRFYNGEIYKYVLQQIMDDLGPEWICITGSSQGSDFAPGLAARLDAACITQVEAIQSTDDGLCFSRAILGGKFLASMHSLTGTTVLTFQPGAITPVTHIRDVAGKVTWQNIRMIPQNSRTIAKKAVQRLDMDLADAKAVVAAGRGIGDEARLTLVHELAALIPRAVVCGSRPLIDLGWLPYGLQVGVTGATVSPALYVACGISGAEQHLAGMRGADFIVSINKDPTAAIFRHSDVCIVEDLEIFIPALIAAMNQQKGDIAS